MYWLNFCFDQSICLVLLSTLDFSHAFRVVLAFYMEFSCVVVIFTLDITISFQDTFVNGRSSQLRTSGPTDGLPSQRDRLPPATIAKGVIHNFSDRNATCIIKVKSDIWPWPTLFVKIHGDILTYLTVHLRGFHFVPNACIEIS